MSQEVNSADIRTKRINIGKSHKFLTTKIELDMLKNLPKEYQFSTFETILGLYVRVIK